MPSPAEKAEPAPIPALDPHKKRRANILERLIAPQGDLSRYRVHAITGKLEKLSAVDLDRGNENTTQSSFSASAIVTQVPSGTLPKRREGRLEALLQRQIVRHLPLPPCPSRGCIIDSGARGDGP